MAPAPQLGAAGLGEWPERCRVCCLPPALPAPGTLCPVRRPPAGPGPPGKSQAHPQARSRVPPWCTPRKAAPLILMMNQVTPRTWFKKGHSWSRKPLLRKKLAESKRIPSLSRGLRIPGSWAAVTVTRGGPGYRPRAACLLPGASGLLPDRPPGRARGHCPERHKPGSGSPALNAELGHEALAPRSPAGPGSLGILQAFPFRPAAGPGHRGRARAPGRWRGSGGGGEPASEDGPVHLGSRRYGSR